MSFLSRNTASASGRNGSLPIGDLPGISCYSEGETLVVNFTEIPIVSFDRSSDDLKARRGRFRKSAARFKADPNRSEPIVDRQGNTRYFFAGDGNSKLGPAFIDVSQIPGYSDEIRTSSGHLKIGMKGTCPEGVPCGDRGCYAINAVKRYSDVKRRYLEDNTALLREGHCKEFADFIVERARGHLAVRFNTYGDFVNYGHFMATVDVARRLPDKEILAFTKAFGIIQDAVGRQDFSMPANYTLLLSAWKGMWPIPEELRQRFPVAEYVDNPDEGKDRAKLCKGNCSKCAYCIGLPAGDWVYLVNSYKRRNRR